MANTMKTCPACGAQSAGRFCAECGAPLGDRSCPQCGAKLSARAKFCADCGTLVAPHAARTPAAGGGPGQRLPWIIGGVATLALIAVVVVVVGRGGGPAAPEAQASGPFDPNAPASTDIANLSPREAADRLFDRVMRAHSGGDTAQVSFFGPMTLQAYASVSPLDADARLHIGLVGLAINQPEVALAQADTILRENRTHLFGLALRARAQADQNEPASARRAFQAYLDAYASERARNLPEYGMHDTYLTDVKGAAEAALR
jgi:hypothetical protein